MKKVEPSSEEIKDLLKQARERIESAEALVKIGNYRDAMSRAYYAFFDAASAVKSAIKTAKEFINEIEKLI